MKLLSEIVESKEIKTQLLEEQDGFGQLIKTCYITGPFIVTEEKNKNGRVYKKDTMLKEVENFINTKISKNRAAGELNHPESPSINLERISHYITELTCHDNVFIGRAKIASTPMGLVAQTLIKDGYQLGVSTRGLGSVSDDGEVGDDFKLVTIDLVSDPSAHNALVESLFESKNYFIENGEIFEEPINTLKEKFSKMPKKDSEAYLVEAVRSFINSLK